MWNKDQMRDHIIDQIIKMIMLHRHSPYFYNLKFQLDQVQVALDTFTNELLKSLEGK